MGIVLQNYPNGHSAFGSNPPLPMVEKCAIAFHNGSRHTRCQVEVETLLDTGTDITIVKQEKFRELEQGMGRSRIPMKRHIQFSGTYRYAFPLTFVFPGGASYVSQYGFITTKSDDSWFDVGDVWLGQDVLAKLVVIFNGPAKTITIEDPHIP